MRKGIPAVSLIAFLLALPVMTEGRGFRVGGYGSANSTWLLNSNISARGPVADYESTFGGNMELSGGYDFSDNIGFSIGISYARNHQKLKGEYPWLFGETLTYQSKTKLKYFDFPVLFRAFSESGPYAELGPQYSILIFATEDYSTRPDIENDAQDTEYKSNFQKTLLSAVLGFGTEVTLSRVVLLRIGFRFGYSLTDVTRKYDEQTLQSLTNNKEVGTYLRFAHHDADEKYSYKKTSRLYGGLQIGITLRFED